MLRFSRDYERTWEALGKEGLFSECVWVGCSQLGILFGIFGCFQEDLKLDSKGGGFFTSSRRRRRSGRGLF